MSSNTNEVKYFESFDTYITYRDKYFQNAEEYIKYGEFRKASEMLWGSITQSIKALALTSNIKIDTHGQFFTYLREISKELNDDYYYSTFVQLNDLHRNFYDEFIPKDSFHVIYKISIEFLRKIDELLRERVIETSNSD